MSDIGLGLLDVVSMVEMAVWSGVEMNGAEQARQVMALRVVQSSRTGGWCCAEADFVSSSVSYLPWRPQWPGTHMI